MSFAAPLAQWTALLALAGALLVANASAEDSPAPQTVIETRQKGFKKMGAAMKAIVDQLKSDAPDGARMTAAAQAISSGAQELPGWFPAGSGGEAGVETDALSHIWQDRAKFDSLTHRLIAESKALAAALSGGDIATARTQAKVVGDACSTCHRSFRAD